MPPGAYLLTIDIGNTTISFALHNRGSVKNTFISGKTVTSTARNEFYYFTILKKIAGHAALRLIKHAAVSSVVPKIDPIIRQLCIKRLGIAPFFVNHKNCGINIEYSKPRQVGADRLANAVAGKSLYGYPLIVLDFGTAITFDCIGKRGEYTGGIILPGAELTANALHEHTAKLPMINPFIKPAALIGKNTKDAILSGIYYGTEGGLNLILEKLKTALQCDKIILTGGHAAFFKNRIKGKTILALGLTHTGIRKIWENRGGNK